ncbi:MAG TPA: M4 family metallopeptidase [Chthonomonadaceae bacterium]|nr:M4 family metallopeptidase [Chthonomonadaceae bacterium]
MPPHILHQILKNGSQKQRDAALKALVIDPTMRLARATYQLLENGAHQALMASTPTQAQRTIYTADNGDVLPGHVVQNEGQAPLVDDPAVQAAYQGLGNTFDFYHAAYNRNSIDDEGMHLDATIHYEQGYNNAFWNGQQMIFGDGDGEIFKTGGFTSAIDVIGHELTHGVTGHEVNLVYMGQPGALNESISDVFGSLVKQFILKQTADQADWLIGAGLLVDAAADVAIRSMKAPGTAYSDPVLGQDPQPATMDKFLQTTEDNGGVHINSGIPNHAFYLAATQIGGFAWEKTGRIWYETIRDPRLQNTATFVDFAIRTVINAGHLFGDNSNEQQAVRKAWQQVGIQVPGS